MYKSILFSGENIALEEKIRSKVLILVRHPEAIKNTEYRHGGDGSTLSGLGREQCYILAKFLKTLILDYKSVSLVGHRIVHVEETVNFIEKNVGVKVVWDDRLRGINMGDIANLREREVEDRWPEVAKRLEMWRNGRLKINELNLPGAEPIDSFHCRIKSLYNDWICKESSDLLIAICTRSTLIMIINMVLLGQYFSYDNYKAYHFHPISISKIMVRGFSSKVVSINESLSQ